MKSSDNWDYIIVFEFICCLFGICIPQLTLIVSRTNKKWKRVETREMNTFDRIWSQHLSHPVWMFLQQISVEEGKNGAKTDRKIHDDMWFKIWILLLHSFYEFTFRCTVTVFISDKSFTFCNGFVIKCSDILKFWLDFERNKSALPVYVTADNNI